MLCCCNANLHNTNRQVLLLLVLGFIVQFSLGMEVNSEQNCLEDSCNEEKKNSFALVPYHNNKVLSEFYQPLKEFSFSNIGKVKIMQEYDNFGVAGVVWEGAKVLGDYLAAEHQEVHGKQILELGAGTGLAGIVASKLGANVTLTDLDKNLQILKKNVALNFAAHEDNAPFVEELEWNVDLHKFSPSQYDLVIGADLIYSVGSFRSLLKTLVHFAADQENHPSSILLSSKLRYDRVETFIKMAKLKLDSELVHFNKEANVVIYQFTRANS